MSDAISPAGNQGVSPPSAALAAAQSVAAQASPRTDATTVASAQAGAIHTAAAQSQAAAKLELSETAAQATAKAPVNAVMTMEEAAQAFQDYLNSLPSNLQFKPDYEAGIVVFKVVNPVTQKVIRQLPPEEVVNQVRNMRLAEKRGHSGILLDESF
ncbi:flagellar protein FlaG [Mesoterricola sediminis]|uniref:Flagellar protein FlaG n=1 Tax=Mesoterricola sediminis TaxID=2927980 RepID=A0AA48GT69_9BACT|nr:flagellar protein FlaG [Mesoterricola sediminis]BDU78821.1 hypothetical protein METESE_37790 [Mesoterricola sediminis]